MEHQFALHIKDLPLLNQEKIYTIEDADLVHRIVHVLRLKIDALLMLFSHTHKVQATITCLTKRTVTVKIIECTPTKNLSPRITVFLPMLKRTALEEALYSCTELGAQDIQLIYTTKTPHSTVTEKEVERYERISIAAAEQSKNYQYALVHKPLPLSDALKKWKTKDTQGIFGDPSGTSFTNLTHKSNTPLIVCIGPEGDLTDQEKVLLKHENFTFMHLTPTILRAQQALTVMLGLIRSL